ncbi:ABC transporter substrate-binding protein [Gallaecimonas mangrovi]|uniref:ABC transporter substrate-binding protein n=1 Tax=Gallaecimonas mangrovi TaxID=2291597 RepID=UPI000E20BA9B|nr:ABC transporter substrate-binding protein [Gallaecimonas mangrovi]
MKTPIATLLAALMLWLPFSSQAAATRTVHFYQHQQLTVPAKVTKVASAWEAENAILAMLGAGNNIVATTRIARSTPAFQKFVPAIKNAALATMGSANGVNVETLIALHPDILFVPSGFNAVKKQQLNSAGIAVAELHGNSLEALKERVTITAKLLGGKAPAEAKAYQAYFRHNEQLIAKRLAAIPKAKRLRVYLASGRALSTSASPSLDQDWLNAAGAINVAAHWQLSKERYHAPNVSLESVLAANPDVIIAMRAEDAETILHDPRWQTINAVKNGRVYANPRGLFWWCRETSEQALQILWAAKTLYPSAFSDIDMAKETQQFYRRFFHIQLSGSDVQQFLHPLTAAHGH